jgi:Ca2+-binding EF-hand superfamily protein
MLAAAQVYNTPFLQTYLFTPGETGVLLTDVTTSRQPNQAGALPGLPEAYAIAFEEFPLDRMVDELGKPLKDVSRSPSRWLTRAEIERILEVPAERLGLGAGGAATSLGEGARLHLARFDADRSGMLEGGEVEQAGLGLDRDADGRVSLAELGIAAGMQESAAAPAPAFLASRVDPDGDLARLFDGLDLHAFDRDKDARLDRKEAARALFQALDLSGDERVQPDELSRYPGDFRRLRYHDGEAAELLERLDKNADGSVSQRECVLGDAEWQALDADGDGAVQLSLAANASGARRGGEEQSRPVEWPYRREPPYALPPTLGREGFLAAFDADKDGQVTQREMKARPELFATLDADGSGLLERSEVDLAFDRLDREGVDATVDDFLGRYDLDGDGRVQPGEIQNASVLGARGILELQTRR